MATVKVLTYSLSKMGRHWRLNVEWHDLIYAWKGAFLLLSSFYLFCLFHYPAPKAFSSESRASLRNDYPWKVIQPWLVLILAYEESPIS